jgi:putative addiction module component (TIGR02574 family)
MNIPKPVEEMSVTEKIQMMESLWNELCRDAGNIQSPAWHEAVLAERAESLQNGEDAFQDWESAKSDIRKQLP